MRNLRRPQTQIHKASSHGIITIPIAGRSIKGSEKLLEFVIGKCPGQRSQPPIADPWNSRNQRVDIISLEGAESEICPQTGADALYRTRCTPFTVTGHKLLYIFRPETTEIQRTAFTDRRKELTYVADVR
jgi:hypothetical protein